jgi:N-formylglutamate amidohydrolase
LASGSGGYEWFINPPFVAFDGSGSVMATAIHAGHTVRPEISALIALDEDTRLREEDPYTDLLAQAVSLRVVADRSRFEVDLNRTRHDAVYLKPEQAWGLEVWKVLPTPTEVEASLRIHDQFYEEMARRLDQLATAGPFVVLDIHSYNHRRDGPETAPADAEGNPDVNVGTGALDRTLWGGLVDSFMVDLKSRLPATSTIAENVRFKGGYFSTWVAERFGGRGCCLALEFKKTFMDEWTGEADFDRVATIRSALADTIPALVTELGRL